LFEKSCAFDVHGRRTKTRGIQSRFRNLWVVKTDIDGVKREVGMFQDEGSKKL
jgi:hypothetical protein